MKSKERDCFALLHLKFVGPTPLFCCLHTNPNALCARTHTYLISFSLFLLFSFLFFIFESVLTSFFILFFWSKYWSHFNYTNSFKSLYENILGLLSHVLGCEVKISLPDTENFIVVLLVVLNKEQLRWMDAKKNKLNITAKMKLS